MKQSLSSLIGKATATFDDIELLRRIMPPQAVIHIGAGTGNGDMHLWRQWSVPYALIIDADPTRLGWAEGLAVENPAWQIRTAVLADRNNEVDYYRASNPDQDGLISPEKLAVLWPNLHTSESMRRQTQRLDSLLCDQALTSFQQALSTWLLIDCLPVLPILEGAGVELDRWSVLWLRVLLKPLADDDTVGTLNELEIYLRPHGYRCIHVFEDNHPAAGKALFVRDWHGQLMPIIKKLSEENSVVFAEKLTSEQNAFAVNNSLQNQIGILTQVRDEQSQLAAERQAQVVTLTQEKTVLAEQRHALDQEIKAVKQARDEQNQLAAERQAQVVTLTQEKTVLAEQRHALDQEIKAVKQARDEQNQLAAERQAQVVALTQEKTVLAEQRHALDQEIKAVKQARDEQNQLAAERQAQVVTLTQEKTVLAEQRHALDKEINAVKQARDEQSQLAVERQAQIVTLTQEKTVLAEQRHTLDQEINAVKQALNEQSQLAGERQALVETLAQEKTVLAEQGHALDQEINALKHVRDEQSRLAAERQTQVVTLTKEKTALLEELRLLGEEITGLSKVRDEQARIAIEVHHEFEQLQTKLHLREIHVVKLENELAERDVRQRMLNEEMIKAEAQIDLIKDVLIR